MMKSTVTDIVRRIAKLPDSRAAAALILAALLAVPAIPGRAFAAPAAAPAAAASRIAVVNVAYVIDESAPGKEGQKYLNELKAKLDTEFDDYKKEIAKEKSAKTKTAEKETELSNYFGSELARVTGLVSAELNKLCAQWLQQNAPQALAVIPAHTVIAIRPEDDISPEILKQLNGVKIDFAAGAAKRDKK